MTDQDTNKLVAKAIAYLKKRQYLDAANVFRTLYDSTQDPKAAHDLAYCFNLAGKFQAAENWFRKAEVLWNKPAVPTDSMESVKCPYCDATKFKKVWVGNAADAYPEIHGVFDPIKTWVRCSVCGLVFTNPRPTKQALKAYYSAFYASHNGIQNETQAEVAFDRLLYGEKLLKSLEKLRGGTVGTLLEIGSGVGFLLSMADYRGWSATGMELNLDTVTFCKKTFGCNIIEADLENYAFDANSRFDVIIMQEVLEHLCFPIDTMHKVIEVLAPGGILLLSTPDLSHPFHRLFGQADPMWSVASHLTYWSQTEIENLLHANGLSLERMDSSPLYRGSRYYYAKRDQ